VDKLKNHFPRDDYEEFIQLVLIFLGGIPPNGIRFRQPGAYHLTRWMSKAIYCLKILMFCDQFQISTKEKKSLEDICSFIVECYIQVWISAPDIITAPINDIMFLKKLLNYNNNKLGEVALKKCKNHLWYLNEECAVFSLFDDRVDYSTKHRMANPILQGYEENINEEENENENKNFKLITLITLKCKMK